MTKADIKSKHSKLIALLLFCLIFIIDYLILTQIPQPALFHGLQWNWQGKILSTLWALVIIYGFKFLSPKEVGLVHPRSNKDYRFALYFGFLCSAIIFILDLSQDTSFLSSSEISLETILFQLVMPGINEELVYRGILLAVLNRAFTKKWSFLSIKFGFGAVLVSILFVLIHTVQITPEHTLWLNTNIFDWLALIFFAMVFVLMREKTGSIWPGVIFHGLIDGMHFVLAYLLMVMGA